MSASFGGNETVVWNRCSYYVPAMVGTNASTKKYKFLELNSLMSMLRSFSFGNSCKFQSNIDSDYCVCIFFKIYAVFPRGCYMFQQKGLIYNYCRSMIRHHDQKIFWSSLQWWKFILVNHTRNFQQVCSLGWFYCLNA